jgi:hypothetical protein
MNATELFKGAEDVARFIRGLEGLLAIKDVLKDTASLVQAAEEARAAHAKAIAERDAVLEQQAAARDTLAAIEAEIASLDERRQSAAAAAQAADTELARLRERFTQ